MIAVIDSRTPQKAQDALTDLGYDICALPCYQALDAPVSGHPDMLLFFAPDAICCTKGYADCAKKELQCLSLHTGRRIVLVDREVQRTYPNDILLNAATVGKFLFCLPPHTADELLGMEEYQICPVKQGYAKCSTLPIGNGALITEDPSIARAASAACLDVLKVTPYAVSLAGYSTGFLGGACSYAPYRDYGQILFCGDLDQHPDAKAIRTFCAKHCKEPISLGSFPLTDVGTIFLL